MPFLCDTFVLQSIYMTQSLPQKHFVIYADDDQDDLDFVKEAFSKYSRDVEVLTFGNGSTVLSYLSSLSPFEPAPCLIILDINMPLIDGKEVLTRLRQSEVFESVPVILFTTSSLPKDKRFADEHKASLVTKPLSVQHMQAVTDRFIDHCTEEVREKIRK
jgi:CheY-like chemotaxis protein